MFILTIFEDTHLKKGRQALMLEENPAYCDWKQIF